MKTKTLYLFDEVTGEFKGAIEAHPSPAEEGVYLEPIHSTELPPPVVDVNQVAVFASGAWTLQPDFRTKTIYDQSSGASQEVTTIGLIPTGFALTPPPPTSEQLIAALESALDAYIDSVAKDKGYDSRITATMRAGYVNPWQAEGIAFGQWMDACYVKAFEIQAAVAAGQRAIPTADELIAEMPLMVWPI